MADYGLAAQVGGGNGGANALNPVQTMAQFQTMNNAMLQGQQLQQQMQQQNALRNILSQSGGKVTPEIIQGLVASGNYEPALALQRHHASMGSIGVQTQAAQTALEEARLKLAETKRTLAAGAATRDFISKTDDLTNADALKALKATNPDAWEAVTKFNGLVAKQGYEAATAKRLDDKAKLDLAQATMNLFAPAIAAAKTPDQFFKAYDRMAEVYPNISAIAPREFTPDNVKSIVQATTNLSDLEGVTVGGIPGIRNKRTNEFHPSVATPLGANAAPEAAAPQAAAPVAPGVNTPPGMTASMNATNALGPAGGTPAAPANAMANAAVPSIQQMLAAEAERKSQRDINEFRQKEEIKSEIAANRPVTPMTAQQEAKMRGTISDDRATVLSTISTMDDVIKAVDDVRNLSPSDKGSITGLQKYAPALSPGGRTAETKLANLKGRVTAMGKAAASMSGALGNMAVQEWKIVQDQIASLDTAKMNAKDLNDQLDIIASQAQGAMNRIRDKYVREYEEMFTKYPGRFDLPGSKGAAASSPDIDALLRKYTNQ